MNPDTDPALDPVSGTTTTTAGGVLFALQPHFSLLSFSGAADALVTAALVDGPTRYRIETIAVAGGASGAVTSDIGVAVAPTLGSVGERDDERVLDGIDHVFVCGGYRCPLDETPALTGLLRAAAERGATLGGLWNGAAALAHAGLLDGHGCALHPRDRPAFARRFPALKVRRRAVVVDRGRLSAAGPSSALELMLALIGRRDGAAVTRAVRAILAADAGPSGAGAAAFAEDDERSLPVALATALELMRNNLDEPLSRAELARHAGTSVRTLERAFREHLETSPAGHYLELRLQRAAERLAGDRRPLAEIAHASGFSGTAAFGRAFARRFGRSPRAWRAAGGRVDGAV